MKKITDAEVAEIGDLSEVALMDTPRTPWDAEAVLESAKNVPRLLADRRVLMTEIADVREAAQGLVMVADIQLAEAVHRADAAEGLLREIEAYCAPIAAGLDPVGLALYERIGPLLCDSASAEE